MLHPGALGAQPRRVRVALGCCTIRVPTTPSPSPIHSGKSVVFERPVYGLTFSACCFILDANVAEAVRNFGICTKCEVSRGGSPSHLDGLPHVRIYHSQSSGLNGFWTTIGPSQSIVRVFVMFPSGASTRLFGIRQQQLLDQNWHPEYRQHNSKST